MARSTAVREREVVQDLPVRDLRTFQPNDLTDAEFVLKRSFMTVPEAEEPEDLLVRERWAVIARHLPRWSVITVVPQGGRWLAEVRIIDCGAHWAVPVLEAVHRYDQADVLLQGVPHGFRVIYNGPAEGYVAIRQVDGVVVISGAPSAAAALEQLRDHPSMREYAGGL